jgi:hypothetical protein
MPEKAKRASRGVALANWSLRSFTGYQDRVITGWSRDADAPQQARSISSANLFFGQ